MMKKYIVIFLVFVLRIAWADMVLKASAQPVLVRIGDPIEFTVQLTYPETLKAGLLLAGQKQLGPFEVLSIKPDSVDTFEGNFIRRFRFKLALYNPNDAFIPPVGIVTVSKAGVAETLFTQAIPVKFLSLVPPEAVDSMIIRDVKPPLPLKFPVKFFVIRGVIGLGLAAFILALLWYLSLRRRGVSFISLISPPRPAWERALEMLRSHTATDLLKNGEVKEYFDRLTDILRWYIEHRFGVSALELSTTEILENLRRTKLDVPPLEAEYFISKTEELLRRADLVKFAKFIPDMSVAQKDTETVRELIERTIPAPTEEESEEATVKTDETHGASAVNNWS